MLKRVLFLVSTAIQLLAIFAIIRDFSGYPGTLGSLGAICILYLIVCLIVLVADTVCFYIEINRKGKAYTPLVYQGYMNDIFFLEFMVLFLVTAPGVAYRRVHGLDT